MKTMKIQSILVFAAAAAVWTGCVKEHPVMADGQEYGAAGIGGGLYGKFSSITIGSGITRVRATMGSIAQVPIGKSNNDQGSGDVTIDGVKNPSAGATLTNLKWVTSTSANTNDTWTLTHK